GLDLGLEALLGHRALDALGDLTVAEQQQRRDGHDLVLRGGLDVLVGVELDDLQLGPLAGDLLDDRGDHAARAAPGSPEVHQHGLVGLDDLRLEVRIGDLVDAGHVAPCRGLTSESIGGAATPTPRPRRRLSGRVPRWPWSRTSRPAARSRPDAARPASRRPAAGTARTARAPRAGAG